MGRYRHKGGTEAWLYCITDGENFKIGWAVDPDRRLKQLQTGNPRALTMHSRLKCKNTAQAMMRERNLHKKHKRHRILGEWFTAEVADEPFWRYTYRKQYE